MGVVAAGIEHVTDLKVPQEVALTFVGSALQLEQRNQAMNKYVANLIEQLRKRDIYAILVKGQGIAQCYERPLWRSSGDVDMFLSEENFIKARNYLKPLATKGFDPNDDEARNISAQLPPWDIELHANQYCGLSKRIDNCIQEVQNSIFFDRRVRIWVYNDTQIFLPSADNDVIIIFTHFLKHFYKGGLGLRQICDWCRLLWTYKEDIDVGLLKRRLNSMRLMSEWNVFAAFAVEFLGMPADAIPLYKPSKLWIYKAKNVCSFVIEVGNMGHNRNWIFYATKPFVMRKLISFGIRIGDLMRHARIFPMDSLRFFVCITKNGIKAFVNRKNYRDYRECC